MGMDSPMKTYKMVAVALLAAAAALFQVFHGAIGIPTGFGMTVDLVALPVLLALFLFGFGEALDVCILMLLIVTFVSPETWLGASMKFAATLPMILVPSLWLLAGKGKMDMGKAIAIALLAILLPLALFVFSGTINTSIGKTDPLISGLLPIIGLAFASYIILLLWKKYEKQVKVSSFANLSVLAPAIALALVVRGIAMVIANYYYAGPLFFGLPTEQFITNVPWYIIFGWNAVQGILEVSLAWAIAFKFKFSDYYGS
jgi:riboflavin transporter FmnP